GCVGGGFCGLGLGFGFAGFGFAGLGFAFFGFAGFGFAGAGFVVGVVSGCSAGTDATWTAEGAGPVTRRTTAAVRLAGRRASRLAARRSRRADRLASPAALAASLRYGTLVSPTIAGSAGAAASGVRVTIGSAARVHSQADAVTDIPATPTFAATTTMRSRRLICASVRRGRRRLALS
ncbi:MAG TPA: hypothetical protein VFT18_01185, partial [Gaiellaceae bacterium]|nr:hypothetical protein [Gaiellaceae bacterium]